MILANGISRLEHYENHNSRSDSPELIQKRPDVHKIGLSIKLRFLPPRKKCQFRGFSTDLYSFSSFWAIFWGGRGTKFCGQELGDPHERFSFAPASSERFLKNWGGLRAPEACIPAITSVRFCSCKWKADAGLGNGRDTISRVLFSKIA